MVDSQDTLRQVISLPYATQSSERRVVYLAVSGPVGVGKTYVSELMCREAENIGIPSSRISLDSYLRLSSSQRKKMLEDAERIGDSNLQSLATNQLTWYDFDIFAEDLSKLKSGFAIRRDNVYSKQTGELDGELFISTEELLRRTSDLPPLVVVDGTYLLHEPSRQLMDFVVYLHTDDDVRLERLKQRDSHRRTPEEIERQFSLAYACQMPYFRANSRQIDDILLNNGKLEMFNGQLIDLI